MSVQSPLLTLFCAIRISRLPETQAPLKSSKIHHVNVAISVQIRTRAPCVGEDIGAGATAEEDLEIVTVNITILVEVGHWQTATVRRSYSAGRSVGAHVALVQQTIVVRIGQVH